MSGVVDTGDLSSFLKLINWLENVVILISTAEHQSTAGKDRIAMGTFMFAEYPV
ncbi:12415_t:CDS:2 [Entrophospora sp. SA101]|nr:12415_t:CDS:2 [Entrophospora sp. SA101]